MSEQPNEATTPANEAGPATESPEGPKTLEEALAKVAELEQKAEKYKSLMRQEEAKKKENWEKLQALQKQHMTETERALLEAEQRGREAAMAEFDAKLKQSKLEVAAAKAGVPEEVLGLLDPNKVFTEEGEPNLDLLASLSGSKRKFEKTASDLNIGAQSNKTAGQLTRDDLRRMTPAEIMKAKDEGRLDALMKGQLN